MKVNVCTKILKTTLIFSCICYCFGFSGNGLSNSSVKQRKIEIWKSKKRIGIIKERKECKNNNIYYKKTVKYFSGNSFNYFFYLNRDFFTYRGNIYKNKKEWISIKMNKGNLFILKNGEIKKHFFERKILPSNLVCLYIHESIKRKQKIPKEILVYYENTGDIIKMNINCKISRGIALINYIIEDMNIVIEEKYLINNDTYCLKSDFLYLLDKKMKSQFLKEIKSNIIRDKYIVLCAKSFREFCKSNFVKYKLKLPPGVSIPESKRQVIIKKEINRNNNIFYLKVYNNRIVSEQRGESKKTYLKSFSNLYKIKKLAIRVTGGIKNPIGKLEKIMDWINKNITREKIEISESYKVLEKRRGECQGISNLFLAMCESIKIPSRIVVGIIIYKEDSSYKYCFHQWVEVWNKKYWIPYDPTFNSRKIDYKYIKLLNLKKRIDLIKIISFLETLEVKIV